MIREIERIYPADLQVKKTQLKKEQGEIMVLVDLHYTVNGTSHDVGQVKLLFESKENRLIVWENPYHLTEQEQKIMIANVAHALVHSAPKGKETSFIEKFKIRALTQGIDLGKRVEKKVKDKETKEEKTEFVTTSYFGDAKTLDQLKEEKELAKRELTYITKHKPVRDSINDFIKLMAGSDTTKKTYRFSLETFFEYLIKHHYNDYPNYNEEKLNEFIRFMYNHEKKSTYYVNRLFTAVLSYSKSIGKKIDRELAAKKDLPKLPKLTQIKPRSLSDDRMNLAEHFLIKEFQRSEAKLETMPFALCRGAVRDKWRNLLIFRLCLDCCLRIQEAVGLTFDDIVLKGSTPHLNVKGKGNKPRQVPLPDYLVSDIKQYIKWRKENDIYVEVEKEIRHVNNGRKSIEQFLTSDEIDQVKEYIDEINALKAKGEKENKGHIQSLKLKLADLYESGIKSYVSRTFVQLNDMFVSNRYQRVALNTIQVMFKDLGREKENGEWIKGTLAVSAHQLRHTGIKLMVDAGVPINQIQFITGHESADMILRYSKAGLEETANVVNNLRKRD